MILGRPTARRPARGVVAVGLALAAASGGCSFRWVVRPPAPSTWPETVNEDTSETKCTASAGPAIVDTVAFGILGPLAYIERNSYVSSLQANMDASGAPKSENTSGPYHFGPSRDLSTPAPAYLGRGIAVGLGIGAIAAAASAVYGYVESSRCRRYKALFHPE